MTNSKPHHSIRMFPLLCMATACAVASADAPNRNNADAAVATVPHAQDMGSAMSQQTATEGAPRLILTNERLAELKAAEAEDPLLRHYVAEVLKYADTFLNAPTLKQDPTTRNMLEVSRSCLRRVYALGLAYRWTEDPKYAEALLSNLLTVCAFPDWNPSHFLDTAEMTHAVSIGYDWLYQYLTPEDRQTILQAIITKGLEPGLEAYSGQASYSWWVKSNHNWNLVCNAGLVIGALAVLDSHPEYETKILSHALPSIPIALERYGPDGAWGEGPGYWNYATSYVSYLLAALKTASGTDHGLLEIPGLTETVTFPFHSTGPTNLPLAYADSWAGRQLNPMPPLFWLAHIYGNGFASDFQHQLIERRGITRPHDVIWYLPPSTDAFATPALDKYYRGPVELVFMRSSWNDPNALFIGIKAGYNQINHAHLDLGNFEIDALGMRWAWDMGSDSYNLPNYFSARTGKRWQYYRTNSHSHNVPTFDGQSQSTTGKASVIRFEAGSGLSDSSDVPFTQIDLTGAYDSQVSAMQRGASLVENRRAVLIQDDIQLTKPAAIAWGLTTKADITLEGQTAMLSQDSKQMRVQILSPEGAVFSTESAEQPKPQVSNKEYKRLMVRLENQTGTVRIAILFSPMWDDGFVEAVPVVPLAEW